MRLGGHQSRSGLSDQGGIPYVCRKSNRGFLGLAEGRILFSVEPGGTVREVTTGLEVKFLNWCFTLCRRGGSVLYQYASHSADAVVLYYINMLGRFGNKLEVLAKF